ncbi:hypothetical protein [Roseateles sp.]|uniref:hypothetical protein n=1 Tax=Roseateles sp. TaxID=1971397 RepID=UPI0031E22F03
MGRTLPAAYVIATYRPAEHHLDTADLPSGLLLRGFRIPDLQPSKKSLLEYIELRRRHAPILALVNSMQAHREIPATFDGEAAAFAVNRPEGRLQVGERYRIPGPDGNEVDATLESGTVIPQWKAASCVFFTDDQNRLIVNVPLSDDELKAFEQHPSTFFGVIDRNAGRKRPKDPLDMFDFLLDTYGKSSKEKLLEFMAGAHDLDRLRTMSRDDLANEYCARMASSLMAHRENSEPIDRTPSHPDGSSTS